MSESVKTKPFALLLAPAEWRCPWKLATLGVGMSWLVWGALTLGIGDWDVDLSLLIGVFTYLLAPMAARILMRRQWRWLPLSVLAWWWCVDSVYVAWHLSIGNPITARPTPTRRRVCSSGAGLSGCLVPR